ncbi:MAG: hypothetical protein JRF46_06595 [Deltaproteobacteria bacterium]|nr:hypothetical protein [Deltaproteobacteria bacterium]
MNFPAASSGVSIGNHLNRPKGRGIKPLSASGGLNFGWDFVYPGLKPITELIGEGSKGREKENNG